VRCAENKKLLAADSVLIIGGGPVGVELAGEIVVDFPTKKVKSSYKEENAAFKFIQSMYNEARDTDES
jgi:NADH dehydrogenase FAD-containing subunit